MNSVHYAIKSSVFLRNIDQLLHKLESCVTFIGLLKSVSLCEFFLVLDLCSLGLADSFCEYFLVLDLSTLGLFVSFSGSYVLWLSLHTLWLQKNITFWFRHPCLCHCLTCSLSPFLMFDVCLCIHRANLYWWVLSFFFQLFPLSKPHQWQRMEMPIQ